MKKIINEKITLISLLLVVIMISGISFSQNTDVQIRTFQLGYLKAQDMLPLIRVFLSKDGKAAADERLNIIIVSDHPENLSQIDSFIKEQDYPLPNIRIISRVISGNSSSNDGIWVNGYYYKKGNQSNVNVNVIGPSGSTSSGSLNMNLLVMSGSTGKISFGNILPYPQSYYVYCVNKGYQVFNTVAFYEVSSGLSVTPKLLGSKTIDLFVAPYISYLANNKIYGEVIFKKVGTHITIQAGETVTIGSGDFSNDSTISSLFNGTMTGRNTGSFTVQITAYPEN